MLIYVSAKSYTTLTGCLLAVDTNSQRKSSDEQIQPDMFRVEDDYQTAATIFRKVLEGGSSGVWDDKFKSKLHPYICKFNGKLFNVFYYY